MLKVAAAAAAVDGVAIVVNPKTLATNSFGDW